MAKRPLVGSILLQIIGIIRSLFCCGLNLGTARGLDRIVPGQLNADPLLLHIGTQDLLVKIGKYLFYQHFCLGARNKHTGLTSNIDSPEGSLARDVLQRLALRATRYGLMHKRKLVCRQGRIKVGVDPNARQPRRRRKQPLSRETRTLDAAGTEIIGRPIKAFFHCPVFLSCHGTLHKAGPGIA